MITATGIDRRITELSGRLEAIAGATDDPDAAAARGSLIAFGRRMFRGFQAPPHIARLAGALEEIAAGNLARLIVTMPPRHGKSLLCSELFPAWFLGCHPDKRIIAASHTTRLAATFGRRARNLLAEPVWPFPGVTVAPDLAGVEAWDIAGYRGGYLAAGVGAGITGHGAHVLLIDDPIKDWAEAVSETHRQAVWEWFATTARTRLEPGGAIVLIATRWHDDDPTGRLLASHNAAAWHHLHLPALDEDGAALWPERYNAATLTAMQREMGSRAFNALYQGRPSPAEGNILKRDWWRFYDQPPGNLERVIQSWDMSFRETKAGSFVVGQVWAVAGAHAYLLDQVRARMDFPATLAAVRALSQAWPAAQEKLIEDKANGPAVVASLRNEIPGLIEVSPDGGKEARANAISYLVEAGNVWLPRRAPWVDAFVEECAAFPNGRHDDQVDAMTQALRRLATEPEEEGIIWYHDPVSISAF